MPESPRPFVLVIRDGWGENPYPEWSHANAVYLAKTSIDDHLRQEYPSVLIHTSGQDVGLPPGVMGNSEAGHQNIGGGRVVYQEIERVSRAVRDGSFFENRVLLGAVDHIEQTGGVLHLLGLLSDGRVHSSLDHALALVDFCKRCGLAQDRLVFHVITDGRDTPPNSGLGYIETLEEHLVGAGIGRIGTVVGRYYAMDRDQRWDRIEEAYGLLTRGEGRSVSSAREALETYYHDPSDANRKGDEFVVPCSVRGDRSKERQREQRVRAGDSVVFFNLRGDRGRELSKAFVLEDQDWSAVPGGGFPRGAQIENLYFATMTGYEQGLPTKVIFEKEPASRNTFGEYLSSLGLRQFRCAETEKYAHVTFFFNGYRDQPFAGEERCLVPSPRDISTYDQKPEMSAYEVTAEACKRIHSGKYDVLVLNYANCDMVGHTGVLEAAVKAAEVVDECVGEVVRAVQQAGGSLIVTADHGNCEQMIDPQTGSRHTAHTTYDVNLIVVDQRLKGAQLAQGGRLADIAPTALAMMGLEQPPEMTGRSLLDCPVLVDS